MLKIMDTEEFRTAQSCYLFLDEFLQHPVLKDVNDITKCAVCGMKFCFFTEDLAVPTVFLF